MTTSVISVTLNYKKSTKIKLTQCLECNKQKGWNIKTRK